MVVLLVDTAENRVRNHEMYRVDIDTIESLKVVVRNPCNALRLTVVVHVHVPELKMFVTYRTKLVKVLGDGH